MKTATLPPLRVEPELRAAAESVLQPGESLSAFVEDAVRHSIATRLSQRAFIERGLASAAAARQTGRYVPADTVLDQLAARLDKATRSA